MHVFHNGPPVRTLSTRRRAPAGCPSSHRVSTPTLPSAGRRFLAYGLAGWAVDSVFVWLHTGRRRPSSLLNVPVYGLAQPLFEPLHDRVRHRPPLVRGMVYGVCILGVEYASGRALRRLLGSAPWDYGGARLGLGGGLIRLDYLPLWGAFGLGLERLHDALRPADDSGPSSHADTACDY